MQSSVNAWFILVFFAAAIATASSSNNVEKAIKSLEATLDKKLDKLIDAVNAISAGKPTVKSGKVYLNHAGLQPDREANRPKENSSPCVSQRVHGWTFLGRYARLQDYFS